MKFDINFIGTSTRYTLADGSKKERLHLDAAASPLAAEIALNTINDLLPHYSNTHSYVHQSAKISTHAFDWAHDKILKCLNASKENYTTVFIGSGTTAASNRLARGLTKARENKNIVMISSMEHHANDLPHRETNQQIVYLPLQEAETGSPSELGAVDLIQFEKLCKQHSQKINYIAVSSVSNVTGICNPIKEMTNIAHQHGALIIVDAAQSAAHMQSNIEEHDIDFMIFSGHKVYTPMAPGVMVAKKELLSVLNGQDLGGGSVSDVSFHDYTLFKRFPDREQSGTPNIVGSVALACVFEKLSSIGFDNIYKHSTSLTEQLITGLSKYKDITVYGDKNLSRVGAISFNHTHIDHGLFAAILNDYFGIAVRNECFCAHPYVSTLIKEELWALDIDDIPEDQQNSYINRKRGMVRASVGLYTRNEDISRFLSAVNSIIKGIDLYRKEYQVQEDGSYIHKSFYLDWRKELNLN